MKATTIALAVSLACAGSVRAQGSEAHRDAPDASTKEQEPAAEDPAAAIPGLTTETWDEPRVPIDPLWNLLLVPERVIELFFTPVSSLVSLTEGYRLDKRVVDLLTNEAGTLKVTPKVNYGGVDGLGVGAAMTFKEFWGGDERWDVSGRYRTNNGDRDVKTRYRQSYARLEGRLLELLAEYEVDSNSPYYGIGGETLKDDRRVLRVETKGINGALDLNALGSLRFSGKLLFGFNRLLFAAGTDATHIPVGVEGDSVAPPPGFDQTLDFPKLGLELRYDTRDNQGRPTRGTLARLNTAVTSDVNSADLNSFRGDITVNQFFQLLPMYRILVLTAGLGGTTPLEGDAMVPYQELITLGRDTFLRGYNRARFSGRYGWWASAQYQFPMGEYMSSGVALNAAIFLDTGRIGDTVTDLASGSLRYSYGVGFGIAHTSKGIVSMTLGMSPDGAQFTFAGGLEL